MKKFVLGLIGICAYAQTGTPIVDVTTGLRCVASFSPATSATHVVIDCSESGNVISNNRVSISSITGNTNGYAMGFSTTPNTITILLRRLSSTAQLHIEAVVNSSAPTVRTITVP